MTLTAYGATAEEAVDDGIAYIEEMDGLLSTGSDTSEISRLNATGTYSLSEDVAEILSFAITISQDTDGAFNPLMYPIMNAWGFPTQEYRVPEQQELQSLLTLTDLSDLEFEKDTNTVTFQKDGMQVDLGGIAKGYTSSEIMSIYTEAGVTSGMVSLGGNVQVLGTKPDGSLWRVAVQNPDSEADYLGVIQVADKAVITSGGYERYFEQDGVTYHHIIDPSTGYPAESGLASVTIISENGTLADSLSTALFVMGLEKGTAYWEAHSDEFDVIFYTDTGELYVTESIADNFSSSFDWSVLSKEAT